jgi:hypothetical protein
MLISSDTPFYFNAVATGVVMVSVLSPCVVDLGFEPRSGKCCLTPIEIRAMFQLYHGETKLHSMR